MADSFQREIPRARVNISVDLHTGGAKKRIELPFKMLVVGDYSAGRENKALVEREKVNINKNNFDSVLADFSPSAKLVVENTLAGDGSDTTVDLNFKSMKDFSPDAVATQIPELRALMAMRNLLRDLKSNILDNGAFRRELEKILKDETLTAELRDNLKNIAIEAQTPAEA